MSNDLELFNDILYLHLRPWEVKHSDQKYQELLSAIPKQSHDKPPVYKCSFFKPLTPKTKYYHSLIDNEATRYINLMHTLVNSSSTENEKKYWVQPALSKQLKDKLNETEKVITARQFFLSIIEDKQKDKKQREDAYIIQFLKYQLIRLYLEIQNNFIPYLKEELNTENDIHSIYFSEDVPEDSFIGKTSDPDLLKPTIRTSLPVEEKFKMIKNDIVSNTSVLKYSEIICNPDRFANFEKELFHQGIINHDYNFVKKHGQVQELAAAYHVLIKKNYFNEFYFPGKKKITDLHIRKFLNHRYKADIDREFRNFRNGKLLEEYLTSKVWLTLIIPS